MAGGSPAGAFAWKRVEAASAQPSLRHALHEWLYRTPINGSSPDDEGDAASVDAFLASYLEAAEGFSASQAERLGAVFSGNADAVRRRFEVAARGDRAFLLAEDVDEAQRQRTRRVRAGLLFIESYRDLPLLAWPRLLVDSIVELEEQLVLWRTRHARMVERTIGRRIGTGGSSGVDYLDQTARYRIFPELWAVRTLLLPREHLPELAHRAYYGFAEET
jgi:tryptophan 2,3-dioxygenase